MSTTTTDSYAIRITNDPGFVDEVWGPYDSVDRCREVIEAFVGVPESAEIVAADDFTMYDGRPE